MKNTFLSILAVIFPNILFADTYPRFIGEDFAGRTCVGEAVGYGPFDYTKRGLFSKQLYLVESAHFTTAVETLIKGNTAVLPYGDLAYTLRAWPNHHRALNAIARYQLRLKRQKKTIPIPAECWFQRAINYSPNDATTYMIYGIYLHKSKKLKQADANYQTALKLDSNNIQTHYNYGLLLVAQNKLSEAKKHAKIAYNNAFLLPGLKNQLKKLGYWP